MPKVKNLLNSHSPRSAASLAKNLHELRGRGGEDGHACQAAGCLAECQNRCHASPFTYRGDVGGGEEARLEHNGPLGLSSPPLLWRGRPASRRCGFVSRPHRQTGPPLAVVAEDGTSEFPTLPCLFTLFSWAWKLGLPTRLFNEAKVTSRNHGSK